MCPSEYVVTTLHEHVIHKLNRMQHCLDSDTVSNIRFRNIEWRAAGEKFENPMSKNTVCVLKNALKHPYVVYK